MAKSAIKSLMNISASSIWIYRLFDIFERTTDDDDDDDDDDDRERSVVKGRTTERRAAPRLTAISLRCRARYFLSLLPFLKDYLATSKSHVLLICLDSIFSKIFPNSKVEIRIDSRHSSSEVYVAGSVLL